MNVTNTTSLNVKTDEVQTKSSGNSDKNAKFSDELKNIKKQEELKKQDDIKNNKNDSANDNGEKVDAKNKKDNSADSAINGLNETIDELTKLNQKDEQTLNSVKEYYQNDDIRNKYEVNGLIDNNINLQEQTDKFNVQTGTNMNFSGDGQPFTEFVNQQKVKNSINSSAKDLDEEKAIMSTMEENIAIANKNMALSKTKTIENEQGIHKIDRKTNLVVDTIVNYNSVIMDKADVEFFANLVENGFLEIDDVQNTQKSSHVSKTLADMLVKAMNDNKPIRIDFDNNISVIIKIDRAGKISADFLPSSQVAEAYLKENLPLLRQRFDDNNIDYNELNQRQRKQDTQDNRKKDRKNE